MKSALKLIESLSPKLHGNGNQFQNQQQATSGNPLQQILLAFEVLIEYGTGAGTEHSEADAAGTPQERVPKVCDFEHSLSFVLDILR